MFYNKALRLVPVLLLTATLTTGRSITKLENTHIVIEQSDDDSPDSKESWTQRARTNAHGGPFDVQDTGYEHQHHKIHLAPNKSEIDLEDIIQKIIKEVFYNSSSEAIIFDDKDLIHNDQEEVDNKGLSSDDHDHRKDINAQEGIDDNTADNQHDTGLHSQINDNKADHHEKDLSSIDEVIDYHRGDVTPNDEENIDDDNLDDHYDKDLIHNDEHLNHDSNADDHRGDQISNEEKTILDSNPDGHHGKNLIRGDADLAYDSKLDQHEDLVYNYEEDMDDTKVPDNLDDLIANDEEDDHSKVDNNHDVGVKKPRTHGISLKADRGIVWNDLLPNRERYAYNIGDPENQESEDLGHDEDDGMMNMLRSHKHHNREDKIQNKRKEEITTLFINGHEIPLTSTTNFDTDLIDYFEGRNPHDERRDNKDKDNDRKKRPSHKPPNNDKNETECCKPSNNTTIGTQNIYGNAQNNKKVTNIFVFFDEKHADKIIDHILGKPDGETDHETGEPDSETESPESENGKPDGETEEPDSENGGPDGETEGPDGETEGPDGETEGPDGETEEPDSETEEPESENGKPDGEPEEPDSENGEPDIETEGPDGEPEEPDSENGGPDSENGEEPDSENGEPDSETEGANGEPEEPDSETENKPDPDLEGSGEILRHTIDPRENFPMHDFDY